MGFRVSLEEKNTMKSEQAMAKTQTSWRKGQSGNPVGRKAGTGRIEEYRGLLDPHVPDLLTVLVAKGKEGDMTALRLVLDRLYPIRDAVMADIMAEIAELRMLVETRSNPNERA
jgi:hypothetical protein